MENNKTNALVLQADQHSALLMYQGFRILRVRNTAGLEAGEEIDVSSYEWEELGQERGNKRVISLLIKSVACLLILIIGITASTIVPVRSAQLMDCVEVKTNIYGYVISAEGMNDIGEKVVKVIEDERNTDKLETENVSEYLDRVKKVLAEIDEKSPMSDLTSSEEFAQYYDQVDDELKQRLGDALQTEDVNELNEVKQEVKEEIVRDLYEIPDEALRLAKELFGYEKVRTEYYSVDSAGHDMIENNTDHAADIYLPFWGINMQKFDWMPPNTINLCFQYATEFIIPDFQDATVYLYDLTSNKKIESGIKDCISGAPEDIDGNKLPGGYTELYVDNRYMEPYHTYYIKINNVYTEGEPIENIYYVFDYVPEGSLGFAYEEK